MEQLKSLTIDTLVSSAHATAKAKGWWDEHRTFGDCIALVHSELSEALEAFRDREHTISLRDGKPEGIAVELADAVIRIADMAGAFGLPLAEAVRLKLAYNQTRAYRHGGKQL